METNFSLGDIIEFGDDLFIVLENHGIPACARYIMLNGEVQSTTTKPQGN